MRQGSWVEQALCARPEYRDLEWVMERTHNQPKYEVANKRKQMAAVCNACPVIAECRTYAEKAQVTIGFWGGRSYNYRFAVRG